LCKNKKETYSHLFFYCVYAFQFIGIIANEVNPSFQWRKTNLEEILKDWLYDRVVKRFEGMPSFLVSRIWWAQNSSISRDKDIPPKVTTGIILNLSKQFMIGIKIKYLRIHVMIELVFAIS
jgi:hypothetical protein